MCARVPAKGARTTPRTRESCEHTVVFASGGRPGVRGRRFSTGGRATAHQITLSAGGERFLAMSKTPACAGPAGRRARGRATGEVCVTHINESKRNGDVDGFARARVFARSREHSPPQFHSPGTGGVFRLFAHRREVRLRRPCAPAAMSKTPACGVVPENGNVEGCVLERTTHLSCKG